MKELLRLPLTTQEKRVAREAAKRWGLQNPTFADVIDRLTPDYANSTGEPCRSVAQVARWHRVKSYALLLVPEEQRQRHVVYGSKSKRCKLPGCDNLIVKTRTYCSQRCHRADKRASPFPQCALPDCEKTVRQRHLTYCSQQCSRAALVDTTVPQACTLCDVVFQRAWSSNVRRCSKCRTAHGSGRVSKLGDNHDYGLKHEKLPRGLDG